MKSYIEKALEITKEYKPEKAIDLLVNFERSRVVPGNIIGSEIDKQEKIVEKFIAENILVVRRDAVDKFNKENKGLFLDATNKILDETILGITLEKLAEKRFIAQCIRCSTFFISSKYFLTVQFGGLDFIAEFDNAINIGLKENKDRFVRYCHEYAKKNSINVENFDDEFFWFFKSRNTCSIPLFTAAALQSQYVSQAEDEKYKFKDNREKKLFEKHMEYCSLCREIVEEGIKENKIVKK